MELVRHKRNEKTDLRDRSCLTAGMAFRGGGRTPVGV
jgi:hypothetical protein